MCAATAGLRGREFDTSLALRHSSMFRRLALMPYALQKKGRGWPRPSRYCSSITVSLPALQAAVIFRLPASAVVRRRLQAIAHAHRGVVTDGLAVDDRTVHCHHSDHVAAGTHAGGIERPAVAGCGCGVAASRARARHADPRRIGGRFDPEAVAAEVIVARHEVAAQHGARPELAAVTGTAGDGDRRLRPGVVDLH